MVEVFTRERTRPRVGGELEHSKDWFANFQVIDVKSWESFTKDKATQSTPMPSMYSRSTRSLGVKHEICRIESGVLTPYSLGIEGTKMALESLVSKCVT